MNAHSSSLDHLRGAAFAKRRWLLHVCTRRPAETMRILHLGVFFNIAQASLKSDL
eukprot:m.179052 g.179052  ORF g.179052 m.179052 type:complete len:55 (+) comp16843_c0_seq16:2519-2683(+)